MEHVRQVASHTVTRPSDLGLSWRQHLGLAIVAAGSLIQLASVSHHLAAA